MHSPTSPCHSAPISQLSHIRKNDTTPIIRVNEQLAAGSSFDNSRDERNEDEVGNSLDVDSLSQSFRSFSFAQKLQQEQSPLLNNPACGESLNASWKFCNFVGVNDTSTCTTIQNRKSSEAIVTINMKTSRVLMANETACSLFGYTEQELCDEKLRIYDLFTMEERAKQECLIEKSLDAEGNVVMTAGKVLEAVNSDGQVFAVSVWMKRIQSGEDPRCLVIMEPAQVTKALFLINANGRIKDCDFSFTFLHGYEDTRELIGGNIKTHIPSFNLPVLGQTLPKDTRKQRPTSRTKDLVPFPSTIKMSEHDPHHHKLYAAQTEAETSAADASKLLYKCEMWVFGNASGLVSLTRDGIVRSYNKQFVRTFLGYDAKQLNGKRIDSIIPNFYSQIELLSIDQKFSKSGRSVIKSKCISVDIDTSPCKEDSVFIDKPLICCRDPNLHSVEGFNLHVETSTPKSEHKFKIASQEDDKVDERKQLNFEDSPLKQDNLDSSDSNNSFANTSSCEISPLNDSSPEKPPYKDIFSLPCCDNEIPVVDNAQFSNKYNCIKAPPSPLKCDKNNSQQQNNFSKNNSPLLKSMQVDNDFSHRPMNAVKTSEYESLSQTLASLALSPKKSLKARQKIAEDDQGPCRTSEYESFEEKRAILEGHYYGQCQHKDGSLLPVLFEIKKTSKKSGDYFCIWISRDMDEENESRQHQLVGSYNSTMNLSSGNFQQLLKGVQHNVSNATPDDGEYHEKYTTMECIGRGAFGFVNLATSKSQDLQVVVKFIRKDKVLKGGWVVDQSTGRRTTSEISILTKLKHANVVQVLDTFEDSEFFQLVMEKHGDGIDLFAFIEMKPRMDEAVISYMFRQVVGAVAYLHDLNILHRDIKDENIIIDRGFTLKLIDFGSATYMTPGKQFNTFCGTVEYCSPEVILGNSYDGPELEIWSMGVTLYTFVFGEHPFFEVEETIRAQLLPPFKISNELMFVICWMLHPEVTFRAKIKDVAEYPWFTRPVDISKYDYDQLLGNDERDSNLTNKSTTSSSSSSSSSCYSSEDDDQSVDSQPHILRHHDVTNIVVEERKPPAALSQSF